MNAKGSQDDQGERKEPRRLPADRFQTTHWSLVLAASKDTSENYHNALTDLCQRYWYPLYSYVRRRVRSEHEAQDLTQAFFAELLEKNYIATATPTLGKFRAFLITAFKHFISKQWQKANALKRGGGRKHLSMDFSNHNCRYSFDMSDDLTPEQIYERQWAMTLLEHVVVQLRGEYAEAGKDKLFEQLEGAILTTGQEVSAVEAAKVLGMSQPAVRMATSRLRKRFRELLRAEIASTVDESEDVDREIMSLFSTFAIKSSKISVAPPDSSVTEG